ncbi:MAG: diguanylate cyclase [Lachnospiraceae bacterium]|nr:diguanylate cyclase [Lachnospiraceae bacterium]
MNREVRRINKTLMISWLSIILILLGAYSVEVIKQERTLTYILEFAATMVVPYVAVLLLFMKKPDWDKLGYFVVLGYTFMYAFVMFTGATQMVSSYILPLLCFLILYHKPSLILYTFGITISVNLASLFYQLSQNSITVSNSKDVEIRFAVIIVSFAGGFVSARLYDSIHKDNKRVHEELIDKNLEIQDMALQTIATIANTIDAKDEYTQGHSRRVAEYSCAIAEELGMEKEEVKKLRSIALLHDIGKIGVPDSVLNKPGRLTNDEYELMKQHAVIGSEILKDIGMLPGIDIGAKYHHERYDGSGYPEKIKGEEIPYIARIIAVADAFDAMTSNRVYRKHLDMDYILGELERCKGSQFDPKMADALICMLNDGRLKPLSPESSQENAPEQDMSDVSKIWSRLMKKDEEKFKDQSINDELTGLYSRAHGEKLIREAIMQNKGTLFAIDIDQFRYINGQGGFLLGDIYLRSVATALEQIDKKKIIARVGGDEFIMLIPDVADADQAEEVAKEIMQNVKEQNSIIERDIDLTVSIGIRLCEGMKNVFQDVFLDADRALYLSKQKGGNNYTFFTKSAVENGLSETESADLIHLRDAVMNPEKYDAYISESPEFHDTYDLIKQILKENNTSVQLILFTARPNEGMNVSIETHKLVMDYLEKAISRSIKGKDYVVRYSSTQRMILLSDAKEEGVRSVSSHIMKEFYKLYDLKEMNISYNVAYIS